MNDGAAGDAARPQPFWRRWWKALADFEGAMDVTYDDVRDQRISRLEAELTRLQERVGTLSKAQGLPIPE